MEGVGSIIAPDRPTSIPSNSQWLSGQGVGAWFHIERTNKENIFKIRRYTPSGKLDCERLFVIEEYGSKFDIDQPYTFTHISHCSKCRIIQNEVTYVFNYPNKIDEDNT